MESPSLPPWTKSLWLLPKGDRTGKARFQDKKGVLIFRVISDGWYSRDASPTWWGQGLMVTGFVPVSAKKSVSSQARGTTHKEQLKVFFLLRRPAPGPSSFKALILGPQLSSLATGSGIPLAGLNAWLDPLVTSTELHFLTALGHRGQKLWAFEKFGKIEGRKIIHVRKRQILQRPDNHLLLYLECPGPCYNQGLAEEKEDSSQFH